MDHSAPGSPIVVLCVNVGSSSIKAAAFTSDGPADAAERWRYATDRSPERPPDLTGLRDELGRQGLDGPSIVAHRIVHGGAAHTTTTIVDDALLDDLRALTSFAPLHQPACLDGVDAARQAFPDATHVAAFDTAFHHTMPQVATHLGLPRAEWELGIRRYGFHGLSYANVVDELGASLPERTVVAHLGSGASLCALHHGRSVDTTMGLTPAGGVVMATRAGDLDPGVLIHLLRRGVGDAGPLDADGVEDLVNHRAGLVGLSGGTADMRALLEARQDGDEQAALAVAVFCRSVTAHVGALAATLGGIDALVFTGGIGEHAAEVRAEVCAPLGFVGIALDDAANAAHAAVISTSNARVGVHVVTADEERVMARESLAIVR
jgi:acetate kinase